MIKTVNCAALRTGDLLNITALDFAGCAIRLREVNWNIFRLCDLSVATHTAIVVELEEEEGQLVPSIFEMYPDGNKSALHITPVCDYENQGIFGEGIISVTRHAFLDDATKRDMLKLEVLRLWAAGEKYGWVGCLKWGLPFLHDSNKDKSFYCSELAEHLASVCGFSYYRDKPDMNDNVMPSMLQQSKFMTIIQK